jgi:hypothetical protein
MIYTHVLPNGPLGVTSPADMPDPATDVSLMLRQMEVLVSRPSDPMVSGRRAGVTPRPLGTRQAERIVREAGRRAGVFKIVTPGNLRHTYAVRRLMAGENIRVVQETLGHRSVKTTLRYQACILPKVASPADPPPSHPTLERLAATIEGLKSAFARVQTPAKPCGP